MKQIITGNCIDKLKELPDKSVNCVVTSPPYYGLRDYGTGKWVGGDPDCPHRRMSKYSERTTTGHHQEELKGNVGDAIYKTVCPLCGAVMVDEQIGLEETPQEYIDRLVAVFRECKRVLKDDGTLWVNIGDSYWGRGSRGFDFTDKFTEASEVQKHSKGTTNLSNVPKLVGTFDGIKNKDLVGIPWMLAFALRDDGWFLRQDIIWCLSGGTYVYVKSQKGVSPMMVRELVRLDPKTVQLWNGEKWVNVLGYSESNGDGEKIELVLRSGERIGCTGEHKWVLKNGTEKCAKDLSVGDVLMTTTFPNEGSHKPSFLTKDLLWLIGLYLAEGSMANKCVQISLNAKEEPWVERIKRAIESIGGSVTYTIDGNNLSVRIYSRVFRAVLKQYLNGKTAKDKRLRSICWNMPNDYIREIFVGYFDGDGHYENGRIRLGFTRNYYLERDLRLAAARLGATLTLSPTFSRINDKEYPSFRGEWRWARSGHFNEKDRGEIVDIGRSRARHFYDIAVDCDNHRFSLASGVITHNCKPNPMPESVKDRCTRSHEYIFLLSKKNKYYFDSEAMEERATGYDGRKDVMLKGSQKYEGDGYWQTQTPQTMANKKTERWKFKNLQEKGQQTHTMHEKRADGEKDAVYPVRNKRDVWMIPTQAVKEAHFATFPEKLIEPCILAGSPSGGVVLDPFCGSGTTGIVSVRNERDFIGIELNPEYAEMSIRRIEKEESQGIQTSLFTCMGGELHV